jgi:hypothetical protein
LKLKILLEGGVGKVGALGSLEALEALGVLGGIAKKTEVIEGIFRQTRSGVRPTLYDKKSSMIELFLRQTRSPMHSILKRM